MMGNPKPARNPRYLAWIRTHPCVVCGASRGIEASHTGPHGLGQKSPDSSAIPLCAKHHRTGNDSYHKLGPRKFSRRFVLFTGWAGWSDMPLIVSGPIGIVVRCQILGPHFAMSVYRAEDLRYEPNLLVRS
jgi:hypothetical protein